MMSSSASSILVKNTRKRFSRKPACSTHRNSTTSVLCVSLRNEPTARTCTAFTVWPDRTGKQSVLRVVASPLAPTLQKLPRRLRGRLNSLPREQFGSVPVFLRILSKGIFGALSWVSVGANIQNLQKFVRIIAFKTSQSDDVLNSNVSIGINLRPRQTLRTFLLQGYRDFRQRLGVRRRHGVLKYPAPCACIRCVSDQVYWYKFCTTILLEQDAQSSRRKKKIFGFMNRQSVRYHCRSGSASDSRIVSEISINNTSNPYSRFRPPWAKPLNCLNAPYPLRYMSRIP